MNIEDVSEPTRSTLNQKGVCTEIDLTEFNKIRLRKLQEAAAAAKLEGKNTFDFEGFEMDLDFARYILKYVGLELGKEKIERGSTI